MLFQDISDVIWHNYQVHVNVYNKQMKIETLTLTIKLLFTHHTRKSRTSKVFIPNQQWERKNVFAPRQNKRSNKTAHEEVV